MTPDSCRPVEVTVDGQPETIRLRVPGHGLQREGAAHDVHGRFLGRGVRSGRARCACGVLSSVLDSTGARQRWHREHKAAVVAGGAS